MEAPLTHRIWKIGSISLMFIIALQLTFTGFFKSREKLTDHSLLTEKHAQPGRKVIYLLFDALREDFVEWPENQKLNLEKPSFTGEKITLFKDLAESQPENTVFIPLLAEMPTLTAVRVKGFLSGVLSMAFEFVDHFSGDAFTEDNLLYQLHKKLGKEARVVFYGDHVWTNSFGEWFTRHFDLPCINILEIDSVDE